MSEGSAPYRVLCFAPSHPIFKSEPQSTEGRLMRVTTGKPVDYVVTPPVEAMNARRAELSEFTNYSKLGNGVLVLEGSEPADICELPPRHGIAFGAGGCLLVMATGGGHCVGGHAGLRSLVRLDDEREHESVVHAIADYFTKRGVAMSNIVLRGYFGIEPQVFPHDPRHPEHGEKYRVMVEALRRLEDRVRGKRGWGTKDAIVTERDGVPHVNIYYALKAQAIENNIYRISYEKPLPINGEFAYTRHEDSELAQRRNLVFAYRL